MILKRHRINTLNMVKEAMDKGWQSWSAQETELQLLRADRENRKAQGHEFLKMSEEAIVTKDFYEMATYHKEEVTRIMQEFDKHDVNASVHLDNLAAEQRRQTPKLGAPETDQPRPSTEGSDQC